MSTFKLILVHPRWHYHEWTAQTVCEVITDMIQNFPPAGRLVATTKHARKRMDHARATPVVSHFHTLTAAVRAE